MSKDINELVHDLRSYQRMVDELTDEISNIQSQLKQHMTDTNTDVLLGPDYKITWESISSVRFDQAKFKKDQPNLFNKYTKVSTTRRFKLA